MRCLQICSTRFAVVMGVLATGLSTLGNWVNAFLPDGISVSYRLVQSNSVLRVVGRYFSFSFRF